MAGRKPKPTALKKLAGNPGKRKLNDKEPAPPPGLPDCPKHLDGAAREEWKRVLALLSAMKIVTIADRAMLAIYCAAWSTMVEAQKDLATEGLIVLTGPNAYPAMNPLLTVIKQAQATISKVAVEFGLTPASRSRIHTPSDKPVDDFENEFGEGSTG